MRLTRPTGREPIDLHAVDLADATLYSDGDPHAVWHVMREQAPVMWQSWRSSGFWSVTRHADVAFVLREHATFTSERGTLLHSLGEDDPAGGRQLSLIDPPWHAALRVPLQQALGSRPVEQYIPDIRFRVRELIAPGIDGEPFDLAKATAELPIAVFGTQMGLPKEDWPDLARLARMAVAPDEDAYRLPQGATATMNRAHREIYAYFHDLTRTRRNSNGEDLLSLLMAIETDGEPLDVPTVMANCYLLLIGATVSLAHVPPAAVLELIRSDQYERWRTRPDLLDSGIEEALRWATPASHVMRHATRDVDLGGALIRAGDPVVSWLGSANRDKEAFEQPYDFRIDRTPNRHLTFGSGPHFCVGFGVTRSTLRVVFEELFTHFESFEAAGDPVHVRSNLVAGMTSAPVVGVRARSARLEGDRVG
ncbi:cytochrome P450 [Streptomyces sp. NPDC012461]|uniref:Cytochrome P450 n=2 Tax=unclassified Streptomyces TaxID=2593676 RepID=A0A6G3R1X5_9ACTN|nr:MULTISPECIES: cytochrome P450 [unclassified Streptomyces]NEA89430.1 cytochrome P450 [Streptomyces sp. SID14436]NEC81652.1 cytochrome P450 [Streptomyces sp. SID7958]